MSKKPNNPNPAENIFEKIIEFELIYNLLPKLTSKQTLKISKSLLEIIKNGKK